MTSDSRYMYHPQEVPPAHSYPYPSYPAAPPYENGQYAQGSSRQPVRSPPPPQPVQHAPPPATYNAPPPTYPSQPGYPPQSYAPPPPQHPQWSGEWNQYGVPYPAAPQQAGQPSYPPPAGARPDLSPGTPNDDRRYQQAPPRAEPRRTEDRPLPRPEAAPPPSAPVRKTREEPAAPPPVPAPAPPAPVPIPASQGPPPPQTPQAPPVISAPPIGIDFVKLLESYRLIMDTTTAIQYEATPARPPPAPEALERMLQAASYGAQVLDAAAKRTIPEPPRPPVDRPPEESEGDAAASRGRPRHLHAGMAEGPNGLVVFALRSRSIWLTGELAATLTRTSFSSAPGPRTLCNACGLVYAKLIKKRNRDGTGRGRGKNQNNAQNAGQSAHQAAMDDPGAQSSSDEDSYGSQQDRRSDAGYHGGR
uniref:Succinate-semialdehyde dehydrogenase (EC) n=1 Tax=Ganoderma boninense TaxID=34458 RepID=A0A5K1K7G8_9APHY|nr:Succinate-semialdehyde dehydrogenase (EC [Ganoderma boninense]